MATKIELKRPATIQLRKAKENWNALNTFDISNVKSTVTNPSTKYKWISKEDEAKINRIVSQQLPNWSTAEINDMTQWLYSIALNEQKKKDISSNREDIIMQLEYLAWNSQWSKKSNYTTQIKRARLADLIRDTLWDVPLEINDNTVIKAFLEQNPEYNDEFRKFYYDNRTRTDLGKDLWWIEKTKWEKAWDKVWDVAQWMFWWMPKFWEWVKDLLDTTLAWSWHPYWTDIVEAREKDLQRTAFGNYVQDKYWTYPSNLSQNDYWEAMKEFNSSKDNKQEYTPTLYSAWTKLAEWWVDIAATSTGPWALIKLWFSIAWNVPYWEDAVEYIGKWVSWLWGILNKIPWLSNIRDNLQTEEQKRDFDMLAWWWLISKFIKWRKAYKNKKYITADDVKNSIKDIKRWWEEAIKDLAKWADIQNIENALNDLWLWKEFASDNIQSQITKWKASEIQLQKEKQTQAISQWSKNTRAWESKELDILDEQWKLRKTNTPEELLTEVNKTVDELKKSQENAATKNTDKFWEQQLTKNKPQKQPDWTTKDVPTYPVKDAIKELINYYKDVDTVEAWSYEKLLEAYNDWSLSLKNILDIKRAMNRVHNKEYWDNKIIKDTKAAAKFKWTMNDLNSLVDWLEFWDNIRNADSRLSNAYILRDNLESLINDAADVEKTMSKWIWAKRWRTLARWANKLSFWLNNSIMKWIVSYLQASIDTAWRQNALEIYNNMWDMISEYRWLLKRMKNVWKWWTNYETIAKDMWAFADQIWVDLED